MYKYFGQKGKERKTAIALNSYINTRCFGQKRQSEDNRCCAEFLHKYKIFCQNKKCKEQNIGVGLTFEH